MRVDRPEALIVLAAGAGTRMKSSTSKVLHRVGGRSLVAHAVHTAAALDPEHLVVVVAADSPAVEQHLRDLAVPLRVAVQPQPRGTADAVRCALDALPPLAGTVVVTYGDTPLLAPATLSDLVEEHRSCGNAVTVLTSDVPDPTGYGRVLRDETGAVQAIVEHKDATPEQRGVTEINSGIYAFDAGVLAEILPQVRPDNAAAELYLTDVLALARAANQRIGAVTGDDPWQTEGVNDRAQLARLGGELNRRVLAEAMRSGVTVIDPASTWLDVTVRLDADVTVLPGVQLYGSTTVGRDTVIGPDTTLTDVEVGQGAHVVRTHASGAVIGAGASVGPFAYLRPGTRLGESGKIGTFVETKNADIAAGAKVPHLSYVGDASIGERTNIGAGTIFANYDGVTKHRTSVGSHCHTGSDNTFVAPVEIGDGASTGAGTVVRRSVPPGALAVSSAPQRNIEAWVARKRAGTPAAQAAALAAERTARKQAAHEEGKQP